MRKSNFSDGVLWLIEIKKVICNICDEEASIIFNGIPFCMKHYREYLIKQPQ